MELAQYPRTARNDRDARLVVAGHVEHVDERVTGAHRHARGQLFGTDRGLITVGTRRGQWIVPGTRAVWIPPHETHSMRSHGAFSGWSLYVAEAECAALPGLPRTIEISELLRAAIRRVVSWGDQFLDPTMTRIVRVIVDEIAGARDADFGLPAPHDARLSRVTGRLLATPGDPRPLEEWARIAAVSPRTLSRLFVDETGFTFGRWRQRARLMKACELLSAGQSVTSVALELGYEDTSSFISMFKKAFGVTPSRFGGPR